MRFEAKHAYFKDQAKIIKNVKNLPLSLSRRYQFSLCTDYINVSKEDHGPIFRKEMVFGSAKVLFGEDKDNVVANVERFTGVGSLCGVTEIYTLGSLQIPGTLCLPMILF